MSSECKLTKFYHNVTKIFALHLKEGTILHTRTRQTGKNNKSKSRKLRFVVSALIFQSAEHGETYQIQSGFKNLMFLED